MSYKVIPLHEGVFSVGWDKQFKRIRREDPPAKASLKIALNPFLIQTPGRNMLIDCGLGTFGLENHTAILLNNLDELGLSERDISDVFCSHLHYDHIGGLAHQTNGYWELTFPDATIWASEKEWAKMLQTSDEEVPHDEFVNFIEARADLELMGDEAEPNEYIRSYTIGGHTEFSRLTEVRLGEQLLIMAGDVLGTRGAVNRRYAAKYDFDGKKSMALREEIQERAYRENAILMAYHDTVHPLFRLSDHDADKGYHITNVEPIYEAG